MVDDRNSSWGPWMPSASTPRACSTFFIRTGPRATISPRNSSPESGPLRRFRLCLADHARPDGARTGKGDRQAGVSGHQAYPPIRPGPFNEEPWHPIYEFAQDRGWPSSSTRTISSTAGPVTSKISRRAYPRVNFVSAHCGNVPEARAEAIAAAQKYPNVYLETCSTYRTPGVIEELVEKGGPTACSTDRTCPLMDPRPQIGKIITARISPEAKRMALGENAAGCWA